MTSDKQFFNSSIYYPSYMAETQYQALIELFSSHKQLLLY